MGQRLLLFISIILLFAFNINAETDPELPALPTSSSVKIVEQDKGEESFWQKILNFFGFGDKKENSEDSAKKEESSETAQTERDENINDIISIDNKKSQLEDASQESASSKATDSSTIDSSEDLEIPKGFEDDGPIKLPELPEGMISDDMESSKSEESQNSKNSSIATENSDNEKASSNEMLKKVSDISDNNTNLPESMNQISDSSEDLKLPGGFDDMEDENKKLTDSTEQELETETMESKEDMADRVEDITDKVMDSSMDLPKSSEDNSAVHDNSDSTSIDDSPISADNPSNPDDITLPISANDSQDEERNADVNKEDNQDSVTLPKSNNTVAMGDEESTMELSTSTDKQVDGKASNGLLPAPDYASIENEPKKQESKIEKFTRVFSNKKSKEIELPKITEDDYASNKEGVAVSSPAELDSTQLQFVNNEAQVLILPNDDVVLGELTQEAIISEMDLYIYIQKFWENYNKLKREPQREVIERFLEEYDENFNQEDLS